MTEAEQREIDRIERERRRREALLLFIILGLVWEARRFVAASIRMGGDPIEPIRKVILGDSALHLPGMPNALANAMADAHVTGFLKAYDLAGITPPPTAGIPGAGAATGETFPIYDAAVRRYLPVAQDAADEVVKSLSAIVRQSWADARAAGLRTRQIARAATRAFTRYGWTRFSPDSIDPAATGSPGYSAVTLSTNSILKSWADGYWGGMHTNEVLVKLTGFRHRSVIDERTSKYCDKQSHRDGLTLPKGDPYFLQNVPPLHPRCRSVLLPVWGPHEWSTVYPTIDPAPGWGTAPLPNY